MTSQLELFNTPKVRHDDGGTSRDAARAVTQHAGALENAILETFCVEDELTDDELCLRIPNAYPPTVKTCRSRLSKRGLLVDSGTVRRNSRGRDMTVWKLWRELHERDCDSSRG